MTTTLEYKCYDGGEVRNLKDTFETKEEAEQFLKQSSDEIWISLNSIKVNGEPMDAKVVLHEQMKTSKNDGTGEDRKDFYMLFVDYTEFEPSTYKGIVLNHHSKEIFKVNTGNFRDDLKTMNNLLPELSNGHNVVLSSTFDNYAMDANVPYADILELDSIGYNYQITM